MDPLSKWVVSFMVIIRLQRTIGQTVVCICFAFLITLLLAPVNILLSQDDDVEVVRVNTDLVVLNVTVLDPEGKFVNGLRRSDFKLFVDGREQRISTFAKEETPFAAAVLLDTSGSMEQRMMLARSAAIHFLGELRQDDMAAVYRFDSVIERVQDYSPSRDLGDYVFSLRADGMTALNDAILQASIELRDRDENRRAIIVISDGADTKSGASAAKALEYALAANATIYTVDMSSIEGALGRDRSNVAVLRNFASKTGGRYVSSPGGPVMREALIRIAEELSNQYTIAYSPAPGTRDGRWHTLEIKLTRSDVTLRTRKGYHAPKS